MYQGLGCSKGNQPFFQLQRWCISLASLSEFRNWLSDCFVSAAVDPHSWWSWAWSHPWKSFPVLSCNFEISKKWIRFRSEYQNFLAISNDWLFPQLYKEVHQVHFMQSIWYLFHFTICSSCDPLHPLVVALPLANLWLPRLNRQQANLQVASKISDYKLLVHFVEKVSVTNISQVSLVTCAKGFNTRTPYSTTVQDCGTS